MNNHESAPKPQSFEVKKETTPPLNEVVKDLLENSEIQGLPEEEQGKVIVDRFIGSLVRHGGIESSNAQVGEMAPHEILAKIDQIGMASEDELHTVRELTRTDGLRGGVSLLAEDPRTAVLFGRMSQQLAIGRNSRGEAFYALTSPAQIDGYIDAGGENNIDTRAQQYTDPTEWIGVLASDIDNVASGFSEWKSDNELARDVQSSGAITPEAHKRAQDLYAARRKALSAGIDMNLMKDSAEYIRDRDETTKRELGARAVMLVTGQKMRRYRDAHDDWFNRHLNSYRR